MAVIEFFYDCSSPWTYLAFHRIERLSLEIGAKLVWKPILVGGVFNATNQSVYESRKNPVPAKLRYQTKDLQDWARHYGIRIGSPPVFPVNSVKAMRGAFVALEQNCISAYSRTVFERYWGELEDISRDEILEKIVGTVGLEPDIFFEKISNIHYKGQLRANTQELIDRGGFGSPTMFVNGTDMYFGNDRLALLHDSIAGS